MGVERVTRSKISTRMLVSFSNATLMKITVTMKNSTSMALLIRRWASVFRFGRRRTITSVE